MIYNVHASASWSQICLEHLTTALHSYCNIVNEFSIQLDIIMCFFYRCTLSHCGVCDVFDFGNFSVHEI